MTTSLERSEKGHIFIYNHISTIWLKFGKYCFSISWDNWSSRKKLTQANHIARQAKNRKKLPWGSAKRRQNCCFYVTNGMRFLPHILCGFRSHFEEQTWVGVPVCRGVLHHYNAQIWSSFTCGACTSNDAISGDGINHFAGYMTSHCG